MTHVTVHAIIGKITESPYDADNIECKINNALAKGAKLRGDIKVHKQDSSGITWIQWVIVHK